MCMHLSMPLGTCMEVRGQLVETSSLLTPQGLKDQTQVVHHGHRASTPVSYLTVMFQLFYCIVNEASSDTWEHMSLPPLRGTVSCGNSTLVF